MALYKRGKTYWYEFTFNGERVRESAQTSNERAARQIEAVGLQWTDVHLKPVGEAKYGYIRIGRGKSKNAKRNLSVSATAAGMLRARHRESGSEWVFPGATSHSAILGTALDHLHAGVRKALALPKEFVVHSLRHTMLSRLGEAGADVFSIMRIAGHSSVTVSQRYVHPTPEGLERAFEQLQMFIHAKFGALEGEAKRPEVAKVPKKSPTSKKRATRKSAVTV